MLVFSSFCYYSFLLRVCVLKHLGVHPLKVSLNEMGFKAHQDIMSECVILSNASELNKQNERRISPKLQPVRFIEWLNVKCHWIYMESKYKSHIQLAQIKTFNHLKWTDIKTYRVLVGFCHAIVVHLLSTIGFIYFD